MSKSEYIKRYVFFFLGLYIISMGIALSTKAGLGVTPVSSIPYALSLGTPLTLGNITIIVQVIYIACEIAILRKEFKPINLLQFLVVFVFGYFTDFSVWLIRGIVPTNYLMQWIVCILAMFVIAFGIKMEVTAGVMMLPVDALMALISRKWKIDFGKVKVTFDSSQVAIAVICSLILMHRVEGVREGTVAAAVFVGMIIKFYTKRLAGFYQAIGLTPIAAKQAESGEEAVANAAVRVITIAREAGSGGHRIGRMLSKTLDVPLYDKDLIGEAADEHGIGLDELVAKEQNSILSFFAGLNDEIYQPLLDLEKQLDEDSHAKIKETQKEMIQRVGSTQSCIIVGRLGSYFLKNHPNCYHVFLHGSEDYRVKHFAKEHDLGMEEAREQVEHIDLMRKRHYHMITGNEFGEYGAYHLSIDTSVLGAEETAKLILEAAEKYFSNK